MYIVCFFIILLLALMLRGKSQQTWSLCLFITLLLILIAALRDDCIGIDTITYKHVFQSIQDRHFTRQTRLEQGYLYLNELVGYWGGYRLLWFVIASLSMLPVCLVIKKYSSYCCYSFLLFYASVGFHSMELAAMRQAVAFGFVVLAFHFLMERKLAPYLLMICLAFTMHKSAVIFLPCYWLYNLQINKKMLIVWILLLGICFALGQTIFLKVNALWSINYAADDIETGGERFFMVNLLFVIIGLINYKKFNDNPYVRVPLLIYSISVLLWPMLNSNPALFRLQYYFDFFYVLYLPNFISILTKKATLKYGLTAASLFVALYIILVLRNVPAFSPYMFYWE